MRKLNLKYGGAESFPTRPYKERSGQVWGKAQEVKGASFRKQEASLNPSTVCVVLSQQNNQLMVFLLRHSSMFDFLSRRSVLFTNKVEIWTTAALTHLSSSASLFPSAEVTKLIMLLRKLKAEEEEA